MVVHDGKEYPVRFLHKRYKTPDGAISPNGGLTQAYIVLEYDEENKPLEIIDEIADCDPRDNFSRQLGRKIALGRLMKKLENADWAAQRNTQRRSVDELLTPEPMPIPGE